VNLRFCVDRKESGSDAAHGGFDLREGRDQRRGAPWVRSRMNIVQFTATNLTGSANRFRPTRAHETGDSRA
jgi:hypothetical protein